MKKLKLILSLALSLILAMALIPTVPLSAQEPLKLHQCCHECYDDVYLQYHEQEIGPFFERPGVRCLFGLLCWFGIDERYVRTTHGTWHGILEWQCNRTVHVGIWCTRCGRQDPETEGFLRTFAINCGVIMR